MAIRVFPIETANPSIGLNSTMADLIEGAIEDLHSVAAEFGEAMGRRCTDVVTLGGEPYMVWCISGASHS